MVQIDGIGCGLALRLKHARHLLGAERRRASEVFELVGYANHSVFSQSFKTHFGMSARAFQLNAISPQGRG